MPLLRPCQPPWATATTEVEGRTVAGAVDGIRDLLADGVGDGAGGEGGAEDGAGDLVEVVAEGETEGEWLNSSIGTQSAVRTPTASPLRVVTKPSATGKGSVSSVITATLLVCCWLAV